MSIAPRGVSMGRASTLPKQVQLTRPKVRSHIPLGTSAELLHAGEDLAGAVDVSNEHALSTWWRSYLVGQID
jgi:hypothetical protein